MERFDAYMERCLYGPDGFYTTHGVAGRARGDFITSPEVGPLFGAVVANALDHWWEEAGSPEPWTVYDVGCGPNTLLKAVRRARPLDQRRWRLVGIDRADPVPDEVGGGRTAGSDRTDESRGVERAGILPDDLSDSVVLANELLDNLPFRIIEHSVDGRWFEVHVDGRTEHLLPTDARLDIPPGSRAPLIAEASAWCREVLARNPDRLLLFDYGTATTNQLAERGDWLRTYRRHQRGDDPLLDPGRLDITTDIAVDQLPPDAVVTAQAEFLRRWGIDELVREGKEHWRAHADRPDLTAIAMRSRISEAEALTDPAGLGSWLVVEYRNS